MKTSFLKQRGHDEVFPTWRPAQAGTFILRRACAYGLVMAIQMALSAAVCSATDFEVPPVLKAAYLAPRDLPLKGERYRVDEDVPTDGYLAAFTIRSDFGPIEARGPGMLRMRLAEVEALAVLEKMETSAVFVDAVKRSASSLGGAVVNVVTNPVEVVKAMPASVGRFFGRLVRQSKTAVQKMGDVNDDREAGAPRGAAASTNQQNVAVAGGVATGRAIRDILGYDEQRRHLAKKLSVDPYTTNPILKKKLDDVAWAAFAGGLGIDVLASKVPGSRLIQSSSMLSDWIYEKPPGDLKVWIEKTLQEIGCDQDTIDLFLRQKYWTLTTQTALVMALDKLKGVEGRTEVLDTAVTAETEDQVRFLTAGIAMLARENEKTPVKTIIGGRPVAMTPEGRVVVTAPVDFVTWTEKISEFAHREDLIPYRPVVFLTGIVSFRVRSEMQKAGWEVRERIPLAGAL